jgi:predicted RNA-binding protein Jag
MADEFKNYIENIIELTCGFKPTVDVKEPYNGTIQIWISGSQNERALIMGKEARNIQAFNRLACIFARRKNCFIYIYVKPKDKELDRKLNDTVIDNIFSS